MSIEDKYGKHQWLNKIDSTSLLVRWCSSCGAIAIGDPEFDHSGEIELPKITKEELKQDVKDGVAPVPPVTGVPKPSGSQPAPPQAPRIAQKPNL